MIDTFVCVHSEQIISNLINFISYRKLLRSPKKCQAEH
jgi:hypothetical protein